MNLTKNVPRSDLADDSKNISRHHISRNYYSNISIFHSSKLKHCITMIMNPLIRCKIAVHCIYGVKSFQCLWNFCLMYFSWFLEPAFTLNMHRLEFFNDEITHYITFDKSKTLHIDKTSPVTYRIILFWEVAMPGHFSKENNIVLNCTVIYKHCLIKCWYIQFRFLPSKRKRNTSCINVLQYD